MLQGDHSPTRPPPNIHVPSQDCAGPQTAGLRRTVTSLRALPVGPAEGEPQGERPCAGEGAKTRLVALASVSLLQTGLDWGFSPGTWPPVLLGKTFLNMNLLICVWNKRDVFWTVFCCFVITGAGLSSIAGQGGCRLCLLPGALSSADQGPGTGGKVVRVGRSRGLGTPRSSPHIPLRTSGDFSWGR